MTKKSRFLRVPVEPFEIQSGVTVDDVLARMEHISFQGRNLATARRIWEKMLGDDCTIFLGMAGALSAGGLRLIVAHLLAHRYVDCLVSTGANLYHDLHETRGRRHYVGSPRENDAALQADHIDRVYDTYASEDEFVENDEWSPIHADAELAVHSASLYRLCEPLWKTRGATDPYSGYRASVPIYCPASRTPPSAGSVAARHPGRQAGISTSSRISIGHGCSGPGNAIGSSSGANTQNFINQQRAGGVL